MGHVPTAARGSTPTAGPERAHRYPPQTPSVDPESRAWIDRLRAQGAERESALAALHALLLRAARFEVDRRRVRTGFLRADDSADIALQAADDALVSVLRRLDSYRGDSRFTTWAYKFAILEASVAVRKRQWQRREQPQSEERWSAMPAGGPSTEDGAESRELLVAIRRAVEESLSERQRQVFVALALNEVPIDVLAERLATTRGALYKSLHDARKNLRERLTQEGFDLQGDGR